jgi:hypothetical protein
MKTIFFLEFHAYAHIISQFQNICNTTNPHNMLTHQNYGDLGKLISNLFEHRNNILKKICFFLIIFLKVQ